MSIHQHATVTDTVFFWFGANDTSGSGGDGASALYDVRLGGAAAGAIPTQSGSPTLLSHVNYPAGCYEIAIDTTGFAAGSTYAVFCTLLVDSQNPTGFVGSVTLAPILATLPSTGLDLVTAWTVNITGNLIGNVTGDVLGTVDVGAWNGVSLGTTNPLPNAAADAAGGLPISDAGGLDMDAIPVSLDRNADLTESQRGFHTMQGNAFYVAPATGNDSTGDGSRALPYATIQAAHDDLVTDSNHDVIFLLADDSGVTTHTVAATTTISKRYCFIRGPGRDFIITRTGAGNTIDITADGAEISGVQIGTAATGAGDGVNVTDADYHRIHHCWFLDTQGDGIHANRGGNMRIHDNHFLGTGVGGTGQGVHISGTAGTASNNVIFDNEFADTAGTAILIQNGTILNTVITGNIIHGATGWGIDIGSDSVDAFIRGNELGGNSSGDIQDGGTTSIIKNNYDVTNDWYDHTNTGATHNITNTGGRQLRELDEQIGYQDGAIWIDTVNGASGTTLGENGTVNNPVDNITDAIALAVAIGISRMRVASGSSVTLLAALDGYEIYNSNWTLALGGQSISNSCIIGASVTGIATGASRPKFNGCQIGAVTLPPSLISKCGIGDNSGTFTVGSAGEYVFDECYSLVPGSGTPTFTMTGTGSATGINNRGWKGGASYTLDADITLSHEVVVGGGTTVVTGGANVEIRGITRSVTLTLSNAGTVQFDGITGPIAISGTATSTVNLYGVSSSLADTSSGTTVTDGTTSRPNINSEVLDVMSVDTFTEPSSVPAATASLSTMVHWNYTLARNKITQSETTQTLRNDADGADIGTSTVSDDGSTATRGEYT